MPALTIPKPTRRINRAELAASICKDELYFFVQHFWPEIAPAADRYIDNWHIKVICDAVQEILERLFKAEDKTHDLIINQPPGTTKSSIISVAAPAWGLARKPQLRTIGASYTDDLAMDLSRKCRDLVTSEKYQAYFPHVKIRDDQNTKHYWMTTAGGMRYSIGAGGSVVGMHGDVLITDDPINPEKASTTSGDDLKTINRWCSETLPSRKADKRTAVSIMVMQRLHQNDPTGFLLDKLKTNVKHYSLPSDNSFPIIPESLAINYRPAPYDSGTAVLGIDTLYLDPQRLPPAVLSEAQVDLGQYGYAGQHGQQPTPRGGGMFKVDRIRFGIPPQYFADLCRYWDKAYTHQAGAYTVGAKMGKEQPQGGGPPKWWGIHIVRGQWESGERETIINNTAFEDGRPCRIGVEEEPGAGKQSAQATVRMLAGYRVVTEKVQRDKTLRADPWATQVNNGNFWLPGNPNIMLRKQTAGGIIAIPADSPPWVLPLIEEMQFFPFGKYKDQVDSMGGAFNILAVPKRRVGVLS